MSIRWQLFRRTGMLLAVCAAVSAAQGPSSASPTTGHSYPALSEHWVTSWTTSPTDAIAPIDGVGMPAPELFASQTLRMVITPHLPGNLVRVRLTNRFGSAPVTFDSVTIGRFAPTSTSQIQRLTFRGKRAVTIPAGGETLSDPMTFAVRTFEPLAISLFAKGLSLLPTRHWNAVATSYYANIGTGDLSTEEPNEAFTNRTDSWFYVNGLDVMATARTGAIVAFGDSITEGFVGSNILSIPADRSVSDKNGRYPDDLQRRVDAAGIPLSILNAGIGSNRVLSDGFSFQGPSGIHRFHQDALSLPGVSGVLVLEGINDFGIPLPPSTVTPTDLINGYRKLIAMAHAAGKKIWLGTMLPASNALLHGTLSPKCERYRHEVNTWIRRQRLADGFVDFDKRLRDPSNPSVIQPRFVGPDNLHPNLAGYRAMAAAVPLSLLRSALP